MDDLEPIRKQLLAEAVSPDLARLVDTMTAQGIPVASQLEVIRQLGAVKNGTARNGYTMAIVQGASRDEARARPATAMLFEMTEYLGADAEGYDAIFRL